MDKENKFDVTFDRTACRLCWTVRGFWTISDVDDFSQAMQSAVAAFGEPTYRFDCLADARYFAVQSQVVSKALKAIDQSIAAALVGRVAIVVNGALLKKQAQRTVAAETQIFQSMPEALAWLDSHDRRLQNCSPTTLFGPPVEPSSSSLPLRSSQ